MGLVLGGMLDQNKVRGFLNVRGVWDPSLACVMGSGALISLVAHEHAKAHLRTAEMPLLAEGLPTHLRASLAPTARAAAESATRS